ncbi:MULTISPECIES: glycoside hydrolase family 30 protein [Tenacibaculum]|uniref:glycoside hydrolase family 30 protein n=1 Tax=Tenacibaculum TaxID=104267 RepID=UPI001F0ACC7C|nr:MULTISPECIES: glycoside hydrolase family 30 protein [Tenacibaculum]MCH3882016.1 glycosyl hydrolase family 30 [Tenacibaculum aquimarinum]MDO6601067.1 glycoside hydrolase family 30 protein [Tenacibaculum sp. 1_MG-2023]
MKNIVLILLVVLNASCSNKELEVKVIETSASGNKMDVITEFTSVEKPIKITLNPDKTYQKITGIGGSFTESSAYLLNRLGKENRAKVLEAYFGESGAKYSLTRTHIASCDFSLNNYTYAPTEGDIELKDFTIEEDRDDLIPMIKDAMAISKDGFKIVASPWTSPPWMKDNKKYVGGKLLPKYYDIFATYFDKYLDAYKAEGIDIWGLTPVNEPHGNGNNWESMHFTPEEETDFVQNHLGPKLEAEGKGNIKILGYDQNRAGLNEWVDVMFKDEASSKYFAGTAIHWYESTYNYYPKALQYAHKKAPNKYLIETEGCIDSEVPKWKDDAWYWSKEATDWGFDWREPEKKYLHPKYAPVNRYARDIIGCLNNWVDGWIDWNMVLDRKGGPNWFENWCAAPIIVDPENDQVYLTPIYYTMAHFSKYIRPNANVIDVSISHKELMVTAVKNPDNSIAVVVFNEGLNEKHFSLYLGDKNKQMSINPQAIQTIILTN